MCEKRPCTIHGITYRSIFIIPYFPALPMLIFHGLLLSFSFSVIPSPRVVPVVPFIHIFFFFFSIQLLPPQARARDGLLGYLNNGSPDGSERGFTREYFSSFSRGGFRGFRRKKNVADSRRPPPPPFAAPRPCPQLCFLLRFGRLIQSLS